MSKVKIRAHTKEDLGFIFSTWSKGAYHGAAVKPIIAKPEWFKQHYLYVCDVLDTGTVHIACLADDDNTVLGYLIEHANKLQWIYVKKDFRRFGIGRLLEVRCARPPSELHMTKLGRIILDNRAKRAKGQLHGTNNEAQETAGTDENGNPVGPSSTPPFDT